VTGTYMKNDPSLMQ